MNKLAFTALMACLLWTGIQAQTTEEKLAGNKKFEGATANAPQYKAIYQLDSNVPSTIEKAIRNINNLLMDPRLQGKVQVELIAFAGGTEAYLKSNGKYKESLKDLIDKGVIIAQCLNTIREKKISKDQLYDFVAYVPSGNGELVIRASEGWVIVKP